MRQLLGKLPVPSGAAGVIGAAGGALLLVIAVLVAVSLSAAGEAEPSAAKPSGGDRSAADPSAADPEDPETWPVPLVGETPKSEDESEDNAPAADLAPPEKFAKEPRANTSTEEAQLVGVRAGTGKGLERVRFTFEGGEVLPKYRVEYRDAVRLHPHSDPIPVEGNVYLIVSYELTDPNQANRLAFPPRIYVGQRQITEVLLFDNLAGSLRFAIGLDSKTPFRVRTPRDPSRLVIEIKKP